MGWPDRANSQRGFTAVELIVVLLVVALIVAITVSIVQRKRAEEATMDLWPALARAQAAEVRKLLRAGADPNQLSKDGEAPLIVAVENKMFQIADMLIDAGANVNFVDKRGETPLLVMARGCPMDLFKKAIAAGANVHATDPYGHTAMHMAMYHAWPPAVRVLAAHGADIEARNVLGRTPLYYAYSRNEMELIAILGADVNTPSNGGRTALHEAVLNNSPGAARALIALGARVNARDDNGDTPLDLVRPTGDDWRDVDRVLRTHGAVRGMTSIQELARRGN
jgi:prepilin-type N-terminal cleavage/methylation domain-containing protein